MANPSIEADLSELPTVARPHTSVVVALIIMAALVFSYLIIYAVPNALRTTGAMSPLTGTGDPRLRWMAESFTAILFALSLMAALFRWTSRRQMRSIDRMADEE